MTTQKIRTRHENLARENEKLTRQLYQRDRQQGGQPSGKRVYVVEEEQPIQEVKLVTFTLSSFSFSSLAESPNEPSGYSNLCQ